MAWIYELSFRSVDLWPASQAVALYGWWQNHMDGIALIEISLEREKVWEGRKSGCF